jgi:hypothetical protein
VCNKTGSVRDRIYSGFKAYLQTDLENIQKIPVTIIGQSTFIFHNDAHNHKITGILKQLKF